MPCFSKTPYFKQQKTSLRILEYETLIISESKKNKQQIKGNTKVYPIFFRFPRWGLVAWAGKDSHPHLWASIILRMPVDGPQQLNQIRGLHIHGYRNNIKYIKYMHICVDIYTNTYTAFWHTISEYGSQTIFFGWWFLTMIQSWKVPFFFFCQGKDTKKHSSKRHEDLSILPFQSFECSCFVPLIYAEIYKWYYMWVINTCVSFPLQVCRTFSMFPSAQVVHILLRPNLGSTTKNGIKTLEIQKMPLKIPFHKPEHIDCI